MTCGKAKELHTDLGQIPTASPTVADVMRRMALFIVCACSVYVVMQAGVTAGEQPINKRLADLPDNTALDLGKYTCADRMPQVSERCRTITDFSRFNYDPYGHQIVMFGGGHAATGRTDIDALNIGTLNWASLYPSMSCEDIGANRLDPKGFHRDTGHPVARHTYDLSVIAPIDGKVHLLLLSSEGFSGTCHPYKSPISSVAAYPLQSDKSSKWGYADMGKRLPWHYTAAAEYDPVSKLVIIVGDAAGAGQGGMWVYDPSAGKVVEWNRTVRYERLDNNLVYYPPTQTMYVINRGNPNTVDLLQLKRDNWKASTTQRVQPKGRAPSTGTNGWAFDSQNKILGGGVVDGVFHTFDPDANAWDAHTINVQSASGATVGSVTFHMLDYDPVNNVFFWIADGDKGRRIWAYRFRGN